MQETLIGNNQKKQASGNKKIYLAMAMLSVVALVGAGMWCGPLLPAQEEDIPVVGAKADVPHYIFNMWNNWKTKFGKSYEHFEEEQTRIAVFHENVKFIQNFMRNPDRTFSLAINHFADLSQEEFKALYLDEYKPRERNEVYLYSTEVPDAVDWRDKGAVNPVKDQA